MIRQLMVTYSMMLAGGFAGVLQAQGPLPTQPAKEIPAPAQTNAIPLYGVDQPSGLPEQWEMRNGTRIVRNVVSPTITPVMPDPAQATGAAVIVAPGGGFRLLAIDNEGYNAARWLAGHGIAAFVLKYRTNPTPREQSQGTAAGTGSAGVSYDITDAVKDARAAVQLVCSRAAEWKLDPSRVGLLGFSAGAITTLEVALGADKAGRPAFIGVIYGPLGARDVPADAPPMFAVLASDDSIMMPRGLDLISRYREAKKPVEFHLYEKGGHAFGMRKQGTTSDLWIDQFYAWMQDRGLLGSVTR